MNGFIEVTDTSDSCKSLLAISEIKAVAEMNDGTARITIAVRLFRRGWKDLNIKTAESYADIKDKLLQLTKI